MLGRRILALATLILGGVSCARQRPAPEPVPVPVPTPSVDSTAEAGLDSALQARTDSLARVTADSVARVADSVARALADSIKAAPKPAVARERRQCILDFVPARKTDSLRILYQTSPSGVQNMFLGGGVRASCRGQNLTLQADSAEYYGDQDLLYLIKNVKYREERVTIDADRMTYWRRDEHILAEGNVFAITPKGATMRGPLADYYRAAPAVRTEPTLFASGRPNLAMPQRDSVTGEVRDTIDLVADRIYSVNDSLVYAGGSVVITRSEMIAQSDSAFMDEGSGRAQLLGNPIVNAKQKDRPFTLKGGVIDIFSANREVDRVVATPEGHATSNDLELFADSIDMRIKDRQLYRAMAWGKTRARAVSPQHDILADSIDALLPNQRIRELRAIRDAYATTIPDTNVIITDERDWMRGDTIIASFDTLPPTTGDTNTTPPIRNIFADVDARAFYHLRNNDGVKDKPGVNYVRGRQISIDFRDREVQLVTVVDQASGVYLEALVDSSSVRRTVPDTSGVNPDSSKDVPPEVIPPQSERSTTLGATVQPGGVVPDGMHAQPATRRFRMAHTYGALCLATHSASPQCTTPATTQVTTPVTASLSSAPARRVIP